MLNGSSIQPKVPCRIDDELRGFGTSVRSLQGYYTTVRASKLQTIGGSAIRAERQGGGNGLAVQGDGLAVTGDIWDRYPTV